MAGRDIRPQKPLGVGNRRAVLLFVTVQVYMVTIAISVKPDLVTKDYYERGQSFTKGQS